MAANGTKVCQACREDINAEASICPHCRTKQRNSHNGLIAVLVIGGIFAAVAMRSHDSSPAGNTQAAVTPAQSDDAAFAERHGNDPKALDERFGTKAQVECSSRADDYLRSIASHDFAWDDDAKGWMGIKFDKISLQSPGVGMLSLLSTRAKLSNGFGAFQHVDFYCLYNAASGDFVRFSQTDPADDIAPVTGPETDPIPAGKPKTVVIYSPDLGNVDAPTEQLQSTPSDDNSTAP